MAYVLTAAPSHERMDLPDDILQAVIGPDAAAADHGSSGDAPAPSSSSAEDRRRRPRVPIGLRARVRRRDAGWSGESGSEVAMVRDISPGGVSLVHPDRFRQGEPFELRLPRRDAPDRPVAVRCETVRCEPGGSGGGMYVVGAAFTALIA